MESTETNSPAHTRGTHSHHGSCHCGALRFRCQLDLGAGANRCNCSICTRTAVLGAIIEPNAFELLTPEAELGVYEWGGRISRRFFCTRCGVHGFARGHLAELGGDYVSINYHCLENVELDALEVRYWDGAHDNWDAGPRDRPWPRGQAAK